jgi:hypothetical protein
LDGSSIVDTNFTVGTIFGVWPGDKLTGVTGRDQVASAMGIYGPRTTYVIAINGFPGTHEFLLLDEGMSAKYLCFYPPLFSTLFSGLQKKYFIPFLCVPVVPQSKCQGSLIIIKQTVAVLCYGKVLKS